MMNPPTEKPMWTIMGLRDDSEYHPDKGYMPVIRVDFKMHDGTESYVTIPRHEFDPDDVGNKVHEHALKLDAVSKFVGPPVQPDYTTNVLPYENPPSDFTG